MKSKQTSMELFRGYKTGVMYIYHSDVVDTPYGFKQKPFATNYSCVYLHRLDEGYSHAQEFLWGSKRCINMDNLDKTGTPGYPLSYQSFGCLFKRPVRVADVFEEFFNLMKALGVTPDEIDLHHDVPEWVKLIPKDIPVLYGSDCLSEYKSGPAMNCFLRGMLFAQMYNVNGHSYGIDFNAAILDYIRTESLWPSRNTFIKEAINDIWWRGTRTDELGNYGINLRKLLCLYLKEDGDIGLLRRDSRSVTNELEVLQKFLKLEEEKKLVQEPATVV